MHCKEKIQVRTVVLIAVLCAIAATSRIAFFMLPQVKPSLAIVVVTGISLGPKIGIIVGALQIFVSNMFFGQGPWTLWQMLAFGTVGFISGILFYKRTISHNPILISIFGGLCALIIYGGIMNTASVLMWIRYPTLPMFVASFINGLPFDIIHAFSTVVFLKLISKEMIQKLERIKIKYGLR